MDNFEYQLSMLIKYVQEELNPAAFAMYQPGFITIGYFDENGHLDIIADTGMLETYALTFDKLHEQIRSRTNTEAEYIDISMEF
jgi:hypothetical protein